jgi:hypothetical protein
MSRVKKFALVFAVIGLVVPLGILLAKTFSSTGFSPVWILYVWPTYFILGGLAGEIDAVTVVYLIVSVLVNAMLYAYVGTIVARLFHSNSGSTASKC